jgi:hypothetical protein
MMKKIETHFLRSRCQSTGCDSNNTSISSILKNPSKLKLKHQRSVRFEEPKSSSSSDKSFDTKIYNRVESISPNCTLKTKQFVPKTSSIIEKTYSPQAISIKSYKDTIKTSKPIETTGTIFTPIKKQSNSKQLKLPQHTVSPKFEPTTLNYEFRDLDFYQKLNKFISSKYSLSPNRNSGSSLMGFNKTIEPESLYPVTKSCDSNNIWNSPEARFSSKKSVKPALPSGKKIIQNSSNSRNSKSQIQNVLN